MLHAFPNTWSYRKDDYCFIIIIIIIDVIIIIIIILYECLIFGLRLDVLKYFGNFSLKCS